MSLKNGQKELCANYKYMWDWKNKLRKQNQQIHYVDATNPTFAMEQQGEENNHNT